MPSPETVKKALKAIERPIDFELFFNELKSPDWIEPLAAVGIFNRPYPPVEVEDKGWITFPIWPPSRYLMRMAAQSPELVAKVALKIPESENVRIHADLIEAALAMPAKTAQRFVSKAGEWIRSPYHLRLSENLGKLVSHLALGGQTDKAFALVALLLELHPEQKEVQGDDEDEKYKLPPEPKAHFSEWEYKRILEEHMSVLIQKDGERTLGLLCDLLEQAVTFSQRSAEGEGTEDYSYVWRRDIENHGQNLDHGLKNTLVSAVRDAVQSIVTSNPSLVRPVIRILDKNPTTNSPRKWKVFERLVLYVVREYPDEVLDLAEKALITREKFDDLGLWHEYSLLLRKVFGRIKQSSQTLILEWIDAGPPELDRWVDFRREGTGQAPTPEEIERYRKYWQLKKLEIISEFLPAAWRSRFDALVDELGHPEHPEFSAYSTGVRMGPTSPKDASNLSEMTEEELVHFLSTWQPTKDDFGFGPSQEGLGRQISEMVLQAPQKYSHYAQKFRELDPTYVRSFLQGFRDALGKGNRFPWAPVISLCQWVVAQPRDIPERTVSKWDADPDWGWARKAVASLLSAGFQEGPLSIPWELRNHAWKALFPLTNDPNPEPEDEIGKRGIKIDPSHVSINSVRGEAMHALIRYALWVRLNLKRKDSEKRIAQGFHEMPEVRTILDAHLDPGQDHSLAIRSVYGQWLPTLHWLDPEWFIRNLERIFPQTKQLRDFYDAAWETYIIFSTPYLNMFEILSNQYAHAVRNVAKPSNIDHQVGDPHEKLAEHLMTFYWHGKLTLRGSSGLLGTFYTSASDKLIGHAHEFLGRSLHSAKQKVSPVVIRRLRYLWEWRVEKTRSAPASNVEALAAFGWWFVSGKFSKKWSLDQLTKVLRLVRRVNADYLVLERLVAMSRTMPLQAIMCIRLMCEGATNSSDISSWLDDIKKVIAGVIRQERSSAHVDAIELAEYLTARGFRYFDDLLDNVSQ